MSKYETFRQQSHGGRTLQVHPIWRGIGFIFMVVTPVVAYFATTLILNQNAEKGWFTIPRDLIASGSDPYLYAKILGTIVIVFLSYAIFMLVTFLMYRIFGPSKLGPEDAPQKSFRGRRYRR